MIFSSVRFLFYNEIFLPDFSDVVHPSQDCEKASSSDRLYCGNTLQPQNVREHPTLQRLGPRGFTGKTGMADGQLSLICTASLLGTSRVIPTNHVLIVTWFLLAQPFPPSGKLRDRNKGSGERGRWEEEGNLGCTSRTNGKGQTYHAVGEQAGGSEI